MSVAFWLVTVLRLSNRLTRSSRLVAPRMTASEDWLSCDV